MDIKITNIADDFLKFWELAKEKDIEEKKVLWKNEYEDKYREIFDHFIEIFSLGGNEYRIEDELESCFKVYEQNYGKINDLQDMDKYISKWCDKCNKIFEVDDITLNFVVMVGLNMANAFSTPFNNGTVFYFLEKMCKPKYIEILLVHEITHLFHHSRIKEDDFKNNIAYTLLTEGLAVYTSEQCCPGFKLSEYICHGQGYDCWIDQCNNVMKKLKPELMEALDKSDEVYQKKYFQGDNSIKDGIPTRIGYFVGYKIVKELINTYSLAEITLWDSERVLKEVKETLEKII